MKFPAFQRSFSPVTAFEEAAFIFLMACSAVKKPVEGGDSALLRVDSNQPAVEMPDAHGNGRRLSSHDPAWALKFTRFVDAYKFLLIKEKSPAAFQAFLQAEDSGQGQELNGTDLETQAVTIQDDEILQAYGDFAGKGITLAHMDTGYFCHPEICVHLDGIPKFRLFRQHYKTADFVKGRVPSEFPQDQPTPLIFKFLGANTGHGTRTTSIILSRPGREEGTMRELRGDGTEADEPLGVYGAVPAIDFMGIRTGYSVMIFAKQVDFFIDGLDYLAAQKADVVNISMGGFEIGAKLKSMVKKDKESISKSIQALTNGGAILVAAAGNGTPFVTEPANHPNVIAVAGCDMDGGPWASGPKKTSSGPEVDICAPANHIRHASPYNMDTKLQRFDTWSGEGTSFSTAFVSSAAAVWLQFFGKDYLVKRYGTTGSGQQNLSGISKAFQCVMKRSAFKPPAFPRDSGYGAGNLDVLQLLKTRLPKASELGSCPPA